MTNRTNILNSVAPVEGLDLPCDAQVYHKVLHNMHEIWRLICQNPKQINIER